MARERWWRGNGGVGAGEGLGGVEEGLRGGVKQKKSLPPVNPACVRSEAFGGGGGGSPHAGGGARMRKHPCWRATLCWQRPPSSSVSLKHCDGRKRLSCYDTTQSFNNCCGREAFCGSRRSTGAVTVRVVVVLQHTRYFELRSMHSLSFKQYSHFRSRHTCSSYKNEIE